MLTALAYGLKFQGFGLHSYYLQTVGKLDHLGPWMRTRTFFTFFGQYLALTLPFFCTSSFIKDMKEVAYSSIDSSTKDKPHIRSKVNFSFVNNMIATIACYPLSFLLFNRKLMKSLRASMFLCVFSMANDLFIEFRRKKYMTMNYTRDELH